jgi:glycosyltransferase involved in cell wall biosynthesis
MTEAAGRIGLVAPRYAPALGGVERCVEMLARGLVASGQVVEVITTDPTGRLPPVEDRDGVLVRRFPTVVHDSVFFVAPALGWWLLRNAGRYDVIHAHSYHTPLGLLAALACRRERLPFIVSPYFHGTGHTRMRRLLHTPYRPLGAWMLRQATNVICISEAERTLLLRQFGPALRTVIVRCGVPTEELQSAQPWEKPPGRVLVLAVGRLETYKQTERAIAALPSLPPSYEIVVIGNGPARPAIETLSARLGVANRVHLLGHVSQHDLLAWYRTADVLVSLSRHESFGLAVVEAAVAGCAVVASDIPAHREVAEDLPEGRVALLPPDASAAQLARALQEAARSGRPANIEQWSLPTWAGAVDATLACYRAVPGHDGPALGKVVA